MTGHAWPSQGWSPDGWSSDPGDAPTVGGPLGSDPACRDRRSTVCVRGVPPAATEDEWRDDIDDGRTIGTGMSAPAQAAFIGVGAMVGAGSSRSSGAAGEVAGSAVWLSFALAGAIAALQGYSFAKFGARYPSAGGLLEYVDRGFGIGHVATVIAGWSSRPTPS